MSSLLDELHAMKLVRVMTFTNRETGEREQKQVVLYDGLLHTARQVGLTKIETVLVQAPAQENRWTAVVQARVETKNGAYSGIGDANAENVNPRVRSAFLRVAETRAKARALRDAVDLRGIACLDELDDLQDDGKPSPRRAPPNGRGPTNGTPPHNGKAALQRPATPGPNRLPQGNGSGQAHEGPRPMSEKQFQFLMKLMADDGLDQEAAVAALKSSFGADDLRTVTSARASAKIDEFTGKTVAGRTYG